MLTCEEANALIGPAVDERIEPTRLAQLSRHLNQCAACRIEAHTQAWVQHVLAARPDDEAPTGLLQRLIASLDSESAARWFDVPNWRTWTVRFLPAAAALLAFGIFAEPARPLPPFDLFEAIASLGTPDSVARAMFTRPDVSEDALLMVVLAGDGESLPASRER